MSLTLRRNVVEHLPWTAALVACVTAAAPAQDPSAIATQIIGTPGVRPGVCLHVGCGNGALTVELGVRYGTVQGITDDAGQLTAARTAILSRGVYGQVSATRCALSRLPYEDDLITLLVVDSLPALAARGLKIAEVVRVLSPYGTGYVGGGNEAALRSLLDAGGVTGYQIVNQNGTWATWTESYPADMDEWRQYRHDASLAAISRDQRVTPSSGVRWIAGDRWVSSDFGSGISGIYSSGGRTFYLYGYATAGSDPDHLLVVRNAWNGKLLWKKQLHFGANAMPFVVWGDRVYTMIRPTRTVVALDAATGDSVRAYSFAAQMLTMANDSVIIAGPGRHAAYDVRTGALLWQAADGAYQPCAVADGRVFLKGYGMTGDLICVSLATGGVLWRVPNQDFSDLVACRDGILFTGAITGGGGSVPADAVNRAYSVSDGALLWTHAYKVHWHQGRPHVFYLGGRVWLQDDGPPQAWVGLNPLTGVEERRDTIEAQRSFLRCYSDLATESSILEDVGIGFFDFTRDVYQGFYGGRGTCGGGYRPANGLVYKTPDICVCFAQVRAEAAYTGGAMLDPAALRAAAPPALEQGPAFGAGSGSASADDWPTFRHDPARSGSTTLSLVSRLNVRWAATVGAATSSPVIADGRLFAAAPDQHQVKAFDAASGVALWSFTAGGRVDSPPTYYQGYVLFGCADGWVYSVRAADGALAWRFRAAPQERRMAVGEQFEDVWPLHGSVLISNSVAYVAAGRQSEVQGGIQVFALNPLTGTVVWQKQVIRSTLYKQQDLPDILNTTNSIITTDGQSLYMDRAVLDPANGQERTAATGYFLYGGTGGFEDDIAHIPFDWKHDWRRWDYDRNAVRSKALPNNIAGYGIAVSSASVIRINHSISDTSDIAGYSPNGTQLWRTRVADGLLMKAVMVAGDRIYVAVHTDTASASAGEVWVHSLADGSALDTFALGAAPKFDGLAAAGGRLYAATQDGRVLCLAEGAVSVAAARPEAVTPVRAVSPVTVAGAFGAQLTPVVETVPSMRAHAQTGTVAPAGEPRAVPQIVLAGTGLAAPPQAPRPAVSAEPDNPGPLKTLGQESFRPADPRWKSDRPSLPVAGVKASSSAGANRPGRTVDRDLRTRWTPAAGGAQWVTYDLGQTREVSAVSVVLYSPKWAGVVCAVEVSADGTSFDEVDAGQLELRGMHTVLRTFVPADARFVRIRLTPTDGSPCLSVYEVGIHGVSVDQQVSAK